MRALTRLLRQLPLILVSPILLAVCVAALALTDLAWVVFGRKRRQPVSRPRRDTASVVIPNWNGRDLLERYLPSVEAALAGHPGSEIIVVDNGSTDGSAAMLAERFTQVRVVALERNLGFGGGSNAGFREARNDIAVLLNSDMRVAPDFLGPLLEGFSDERVFAVSCQIFFSDPGKVREETGLTQGWWEDGALKVRHWADPGVSDLYPCFYGGGGSCAFDRRKFLELGGFDRLLEPFYLEDTDLGYLAWKRGWKVFYQPRSAVWHEHRGTIGKRFAEGQIQAVLKTNYLLWAWKNIHEWPRLAGHFFYAWAGALVSAPFGDAQGRPNLAALGRACLRLPRVMRSRWRARGLAEVSDTEAFRRPLGGWFRDRCEVLDTVPERPRVLFVSPYPIWPPAHGGGVFMYQTLRELARLTEVHVIALLDHADELPGNQEELGRFCASTEFLVRMEGRVRYLGSIVPHAVREFQNDDLAWLIHRQVLTRRIDVVQLEYLPLGQYVEAYRRLASILFEHDIYLQSIARGFATLRGGFEKIAAGFEYLRALRWELRTLERCDAVQVCTEDNKNYLTSFRPSLAGRLQPGLRAGIDTTRYRVTGGPRRPDTMLFLGGFRHLPNQVAVDWFSHRVLPLVRDRRPQAALTVIGPDPPPPHAYADFGGALRFTGYVEDIREALERYAVFVCPVLNGSGVLVKLLEAFAAGIPVVSTRIGAEGLARWDGELCHLADDPETFAAKVVEVLEHPEQTQPMVERARAEVVNNWDMAVITRRLVESYREVLRAKRTAAISLTGPS